MASKRKTMKKRRVVKKGKSRRAKKVLRRSRRYRGGGEKEEKEETALKNLRNLRIKTLQAKIDEQQDIIKDVGNTYANTRDDYIAKQDSDKLQSERDDAENKILILQKKINELELASGAPDSNLTDGLVE